MSEHHAVPTGVPTFASRGAMYADALEQIQALVPLPDATAGSSKLPPMSLTMALGNASSVLFYNLNAVADAARPLHELAVNWCGFYLVSSPQYLSLGPFQGKVACQHIKMGQGVCGAAMLQRKSQVVADVNAVPGHIACDAGSVSEIVVTVKDPAVGLVAVLDIDSTIAGFFTDEDLAALEAICGHLGAALTGMFPAKAAPAAAAAMLGAMRGPGGAMPGAIPGAPPGPGLLYPSPGQGAS